MDFEFVENKRLKKQLEFLTEIDKMKNVFRRNALVDASRRENDAEHSWHLALYVMLLNEHCSEKIDVEHTVKMVVCHDLIEIYAGDTFAYDTDGYKDKKEREAASADRLFSLLEPDQSLMLRSLWEEFEEKATTESKFANACDRLQPLLHNYLTDGLTWREGNVKLQQVLDRMDIIRQISPGLWRVIEGVVDAYVQNGVLK